MKTLYLIDSSIYIFNAWNSLPASITDNSAQPANAVFGFTEFLLQIIEHEKPEFIACAFDSPRKDSIRKEIYPLYKANRKPAPENLRAQFHWCRDFADAMGLICFSNPKLEADDIIGTLAGHANKQEFRSIILSADKDLTQFIGKDDIFWDYAKKQRNTFSDIRKRYNLHPGQIADMLALAGDKTDNIPGIPGVGMHAAARLLIKWGNLDNLFANASKVSLMKFRGAAQVASLLAEHEEQVYLCRKLTGLIADDSLPSDIQLLHRRTANREKLTSLFDQFNFDEPRRARWEKQLFSENIQS